MATGRLLKREGIVLRTRPQGEGSLFVDLITRDGAKLRAVAYGARKLTSHKMGHLDTLTRVEMSLVRSRGVYAINQALNLESFGALKGRLQSTAKAFYLVELVDGFAIEDSPNPPLYDLFLNSLRAVQEEPENPVPMLSFQLNLLRVNGFMPELYRCVECERAVEPGRHRFAVSLGGVVCPGCARDGAAGAPLSLPALKILRHLHRTEKGPSSNLRIPGPLHEEVRGRLDGAIRYWLDREIRSRRFVDHVEARKLAPTVVSGQESQGV